MIPIPRLGRMQCMGTMVVGMTARENSMRATDKETMTITLRRCSVTVF